MPIGTIMDSNILPSSQKHLHDHKCQTYDVYTSSKLCDYHSDPSDLVFDNCVTNATFDVKNNLVNVDVDTVFNSFHFSDFNASNHLQLEPDMLYANLIPNDSYFIYPLDYSISDSKQSAIVQSYVNVPCTNVSYQSKHHGNLPMLTKYNYVLPIIPFVNTNVNLSDFLTSVSNLEPEVNYVNSNVNLNNNLLTTVPNQGAVVNLSSLELTPAMHSLLAKGLNFCPTPGEPDRYELRKNLDSFHTSLRRKLFFDKRESSTTNLTLDTTSWLDTPLSQGDLPFDHSQFRNPSKWCPPGPPNLECMITINEIGLHKCKLIAPPHHNLSMDEKTAMAELRQNTDVVIKPADKGSAVVIQNRADYIAEGLRQLSNPNFYVETDTDLTLTHNDEIGTIVNQLFEDDEISEKCKNYLHFPKPRTSQLYLLPKIHKNTTPVPGRPIVSANNSPTERISQLADFFLQPLVQTTKSYVRDTTDFINKIEALPQLIGDTTLCTIDVTSLYTNIPNDEGIAACRAKLYSARANNSVPSNDNILMLLRQVLTKNNFDFNERHYLQVGGTAMGTKVAPSFANLFMAHFEDKWVYPYRPKPLVWLRYIDDIFIVWPHGEPSLQEFISHLNSCHHSIKFTADLSPTSINFLDTTVKIDTNGKLYTDLYCKPTDSHNYLLFDSAHPQHCKRSLPYSQLLRVRRICTYIDDFDKNSLILASHFKRRGYPNEIIEEALIKARRADRNLLLHPAPSDLDKKTDSLFLIDTYHPGGSPINDVVKENWPILGRNLSTSQLHSKNIIFGKRKNKTLRDNLVTARLPIPPKAQPKSITGTKVLPLKPCIAKSKCRYCPVLDHSGFIISNTSKRRYYSKKHTSCNSNNLIYCISCKTCHLQYVGQTKNTIKMRFSKHFGNITTPGTVDPIGRHFAASDHNQLRDIQIHILEFIQAPSRSAPAQKLRDELERKWIHRLMTTAPLGLNIME